MNCWYDNGFECNSNKCSLCFCSRLDRQTVFDCAIEVYGEIDAAFEMSNKADISVTENQPQFYFKYPLNNNKRTIKYYINRNIKPATDLLPNRYKSTIHQT